MNNLSEVFLLGLRVGGNYVRCLVISIGLGGASRSGRGLKLIILMGWWKVKATQRGLVFIGVVDASIHHEGGSLYVILLF